MGPKEKAKIEKFMSEQSPWMQELLIRFDELCTSKSLSKEFINKEPYGLTYKSESGGSLYYSPTNGFCTNWATMHARENAELERTKSIVRSNASKMGYYTTAHRVNTGRVNPYFKIKDLEEFFELLYPVLELGERLKANHKGGSGVSRCETMI